jgi:hypothetical protein
MLKAAGLKTWRTFVRDATCVSANLDNGIVTITPYRRVDRTGNYVPIPEKQREVRLASEDLGDAVMLAFEDAN